MTYMRDKKCAYRILVGNPEGTATVQHLGVDGGMGDGGGDIIMVHKQSAMM